MFVWESLIMDPLLDVCVRVPLLDVCVREPNIYPLLDVCVREPISLVLSRSSHLTHWSLSLNLSLNLSLIRAQQVGFRMGVRLKWTRLKLRNHLTLYLWNQGVNEVPGVHDRLSHTDIKEWVHDRLSHTNKVGTEESLSLSLSLSWE